MLQPRFGDSAAAGFGANPIDLYETADAVVLEMVVPGVKAHDLDINIEGRKLVISGSNKRSAAAASDEAQSDDVVAPKNSDRRYWLKDIAYGEFTRTVKVPRGVDAEAIDANLEDGILRLTMPKAAEAMSRKITVGNGSTGEIESEPATPVALDTQEGAG